VGNLKGIALALILALDIAPAWPQSYPSPTFQNVTVLGTLTAPGLTLNLAAPGPIGGTTPSTGAFTTLSTTGTATFPAGGTLGGTFAGNKTFSGTTLFTNTATFNQTLSLPSINSHYVQSVGGMTMVANPTCAGANNIWCLQANPTGTFTGSTNMISYLLQDGVQSTGNSDGINITHNVAPNGTTATGPRVTMDILQAQIGTKQSGTYTYNGSSDVLRLNGWMQSGLGGNATNHNGNMITLNLGCEVYPTAQFVSGCVGAEFDLGTIGGATSFQRMTHAQFVEVQGDLGGNLGPPLGLMFANQSSAVGLWRGLQFGQSSGTFPIYPFGGILSVEPSINRGASPAVAAFGIDFGQMTYHGFATRQPFRQSVPIQARGISGATRLTSDGLAASGFLLDVSVTNSGTGWTSEPVATVTGCTGAVLGTDLDTNNVLREVGISNPGTGCVAEASVAFSGGGGGSGATAQVLVTGNTLNFPPKSSISVACTLIADTFATGGTDSVSWSISFMATMGATASTTAIVGSPTWTLIAGTAGAAAKFSGSAPAVPAADTTLGGVNLSITPTSGTWNIGGECTLTKSAQI
jgi:hypothetical protein